MIESKVDDPAYILKKKLGEHFKGVKLIRTLIIVVCFGLVLQQISACIKKLIEIPVTTYTHFDFNKTLIYPSVTVCREPPYKFDKLLEYGLYAHPRYTSVWSNFNFSSMTLDELWEDITYNIEDIFVQYGLDGSVNNVDLIPTIGFILGRCYTITPKTVALHASKASGYSITLQHNAADVATSTSLYSPGYHIYVHYTREPFTEVEVYNGGLVDHLYVYVGETLDVKLTVDEYLKITHEEDPCTFQDDYSANLCTAQFVWNQVAERVGCSGPWMTSDLPRCDNYVSIRNLITAYMSLYQDHGCTVCPRFCRSYLYNSFVTDRQSLYSWDPTANRWCITAGEAALQTQLFIYFNSMMVSVYEERYNYDWNLFLSDLGGSVGFLLGLSVISVIKISGKTWSLFIRPYLECSSKTRKNDTNSTSTAEVRTVNNQEFTNKQNVDQ